MLASPSVFAAPRFALILTFTAALAVGFACAKRGSTRWQPYPGCDVAQCQSWFEECRAECMNARKHTVTECDNRCQAQVPACEAQCGG